MQTHPNLPSNISQNRMIKLTFDDTPLTTLLSTLTSTLQKHQSLLLTLDQRSSLLNFESSHNAIAQQRFLESLANTLVQKFNSDKIGLLWQLRTALEKGFKDRVKGELMADLHHDWQEKKKEVGEMLALTGITVGQLAEDLRKAKWRLENLGLSYEKKVAYLQQRIDELAELRSGQLGGTVAVQTDVVFVHELGKYQYQAVREVRGSDGGLQGAVEALQFRVEEQENINDKAYRGLVTRISELEKQLKTENKQTSKQPTALVRSSSRQRLQRQNNRLSQKLKVVQQSLSSLTLKLMSSTRTISSLSQKIVALQSSVSRSQHLKLRSHFDPQQQKLLLTKISLELNRMLSQPFEEKFSAGLRELVNFKFIEMRHELMGLLRELEKRLAEKVDDRDCRARDERLRELLEEVKGLGNIGLEEIRAQLRGVSRRVQVGMMGEKEDRGDKERNTACLSCWEPKKSQARGTKSSSKKHMNTTN